MFCKETGLAAYLLIKLVRKCLHYHHVTVPVATLVLVDTCSSFILVLTDTTFLLFFISHIVNTLIADSDTTNTCLPRNSFLILLICVQITSFWHSFATLFSILPILFSPFVTEQLTYFTVAISLITYWRSTFPLH